LIPATEDLSTIKDDGFRFTLRTMLAAFWGVAALVVTGRFDGGTVVYVGIPVAVLGFVLINGTKINPWPRRIVLGWAMLGLWGCYGCPRVLCPIELPRSASNLYVENSSGFGPTNWYYEVRFEAPVADCLATAERIQRISANDHGYSILPPEHIIDQANSVNPNKNDSFKFHNDWMNIQSIQRGFYFRPSGNLMPLMWIDSERGIFYFFSSD
jgi:hypothetical protein